MSRSHKDGRRGGGHVDSQNTEVWSRRCPRVTCWTKNSRHRAGRGHKWFTHRYERRLARREIAAAQDDLRD